MSADVEATPGQGRVELDVPYAATTSHKQQLDLFLPAHAGFATVLFVHGGSLASGDRKDTPWAEVCRTFVKDGIACAATSYRLFPSAHWPEPAEDVAAAFAWLHRNIGARGGDASRIAILGHSSGCLLATLVGSDSRLLDPYGIATRDILGIVAMGCRLNHPVPEPSRIDAGRLQRFPRSDPFGSRFGSLDALRRYRPMAHLGSHLPPFLVLIADEERFKPPILADAAAFVGAARDCQVDADLTILEDRTHVTAVQRLVDPADPAYRRIRSFVRRLARHGPETPLSDSAACPGRGDRW